jgi:heat shock protein HslJ
MIYKINKVILICGLLLSILSCSTYQSIETDSQSRLDLSGNQIILDRFNYSCELIFIQINSSHKLVFPSGSVRPTLKISDGKYRGFGVCNSFYGKYVKKENEIKFTSEMATMVGCMKRYHSIESLTGNEIESLISEFLGQVDNYTIDKDNLILKQDSNTLMIYKII